MKELGLTESLAKQISFCQDNPYYKCGIFISSLDKKEYIANSLKLVLDERENYKIKETKSQMIIEFNNCSNIKVIPISDSARGCRFNGIIIDNEIPKTIIDNIILGTLIHKALAYSKTFEECEIPSEKVYITSIRVLKPDELNFIKTQIIFKKLKKEYKEIKNMCITEYESYFKKDEFDKPVVDKINNGNRILIYEIMGIPKNNIEYYTEFIARAKEMYLNIKGEGTCLGDVFKNDINVHLKIDTNIYDRYEVFFENGLMIVTLYEIECEPPKFTEINEQ